MDCHSNYFIDFWIYPCFCMQLYQNFGTTKPKTCTQTFYKLFTLKLIKQNRSLNKSGFDLNRLLKRTVKCWKNNQFFTIILLLFFENKFKWINGFRFRYTVNEYNIVNEYRVSHKDLI